MVFLFEKMESFFEQKNLKEDSIRNEQRKICRSFLNFNWKEINNHAEIDSFLMVHAQYIIISIKCLPW